MARPEKVHVTSLRIGRWLKNTERLSSSIAGTMNPAMSNLSAARIPLLSQGGVDATSIKMSRSLL